MYKNFLEKRNHWIRQSSILKALFVGKDDNIYIIEWPNAPLIIWAVLAILARLTHGHVQLWLSGLSTAVLFVWSIMEIGWGNSLFRRILGTVIGIGAAHTLVKLLLAK